MVAEHTPRRNDERKQGRVFAPSRAETQARLQPTPLSAKLLARPATLLLTPSEKRRAFAMVETWHQPRTEANQANQETLATQACQQQRRPQQLASTGTAGQVRTGAQHEHTTGHAPTSTDVRARIAAVAHAQHRDLLRSALLAEDVAAQLHTASLRNKLEACNAHPAVALGRQNAELGVALVASAREAMRDWQER